MVWEVGCREVNFARDDGVFVVAVFGAVLLDSSPAVCPLLVDFLFCE